MKYAVLVNGDRTSELAKAHQRSLNTLISQLTPFGFQSFVLAPEPPDVPSEYIGPFDPGNIDTLAGWLKQIATPNDTILFYTSSHGSEEDGCLQSDYKWGWLNSIHDRCVSGEDFVDAFRGIPYAERIVILTQCLSGDWAKYYIEDPKTLFMAGSAAGASTLAFFNLGVVNEPIDETTTWRNMFAGGVEYLRDWEHHTERGERYLPEIESHSAHYNPPNAIMSYSPLFNDRGPSGLALGENAPEFIIDIPEDEDPMKYIESIEPGSFAIVGSAEEGDLLEDYFARYRGEFYFLRLHEDLEKWTYPAQAFASSYFLYLYGYPLGYPQRESGVQIIPPMTPYDAMRLLVVNAPTEGWNPGGAYDSPPCFCKRVSGCFSGDMYLLSEEGPIQFADYFEQYAESIDPAPIASWDTSTQTLIWQRPTAFLEHDAWEAPVLCNVPVGDSILKVTPEHRLLMAPGTDEDWTAVSEFPEFATLKSAIDGGNINMERADIHCQQSAEKVYNLSFTGEGQYPNYLVSPDGDFDSFVPAHNIKTM